MISNIDEHKTILFDLCIIIPKMIYDNMQKRARKDAHICHNSITTVKIIYILHVII